MFSLIRTVEPSHEPLELVDVKPMLRIDGDDQDDVLELLISAARSATERYLNRALVPQTWELSFDKFPNSWPHTYGYMWPHCREIHIPISPVISVSSFTYRDATTLDVTAITDYQLVLSEPARLQPAYNTAWPSATWTIGEVQITFTAGYRDDASSPIVGSVVMPPDIKTAMLLSIGWWYENRESQEMPKAAENLLQPYRVWDFWGSWGYHGR